MSRRCDITGKTSQTSATRSHSNIKTLRKQYSNLHKKKIFIPELGRSVSMTLSSTAVRNISKHGGVAQTILRADEASLTPALRKIRKELIAK